MIDVNRQSARNGGINISGNGNVIAPNAKTLQVCSDRKPLTKTAIYDLLRAFQSTCPEATMTRWRSPCRSRGNSEYNGVRRYHRIFDSYSVEYGYLDGMLQDFADSTISLDNLATSSCGSPTAMRTETRFVSDGDTVLDGIKEQLVEKITGST